MSSIFRRLPFQNDNQSRSSEVQDLPKIRQPYAPPPLPAKRKRTLTLPLPPFNSSSRSQRRQWTSEQAHCLFSQILPYDIRRIVYEYTLADETFHIIRLRKKLRHVECAKEQRYGTTCWGMSSVDGTLIRDLEKKLLGRRLLNMLRTCRRVYTEAIGVLYSRNKFDVNGPETMISLSQTLLPHRLHAIRSLQLTWAFFHPAHTVYDGDKILLTGDEALWKVCWAVVGGMKGVSDIRIWLSMSPAVEAARQPEEDLLEPLKEIGLKKRIEVRVSWTLFEAEFRSRGEFSFRLIRLHEEDWGATYLQQQDG